MDVNIRDFTRNPYKHLHNLPLRVTRKGKTAFYVVATLENVVTIKPPKTVATPKTVKEVKKQLKKELKDAGMCKHGYSYGLCKYGC